VSAPPPDYPNYPEPDYPPLGYGPPGHPPPGWSWPSYGPPLGYPPPPGYFPTSYPPPNYALPSGYGSPPQFISGASTMSTLGITPLRPLSLSDIFNGAVAYIRANPKTTLGLTAIIVVTMQIIALIATAGPLAAASRLRTASPDELTQGDLAAWILPAALSGTVTWLASVLLSGVLAVVVGRAVFGSKITLSETWATIRGRILTLIGLMALEATGLALLVGLVGLIVAAISASGSQAAVVVIGLPLVLASIAALVYLYTMLSFAPALVVLERLSAIDAIIRSCALVRNSFWRVLGIRILTAVVAFLVAGSIATPFNLAGQLLAATSTGPVLIGVTMSAIGSAIGRIFTAPFSAGVVVLLYTDRRIRAEAFDLVLQTGVTGNRPATASTDYLWLTRPV
jgi:hypothetical protein